MAKRGRHLMEIEQLIPGMSHDQLAALLERHGLGQLETVEQVTGGSVNPMLRVNRELLVRFNRRDPDQPKLAKEALIYRRLRRSTDVPCPQVLALDTQRDLVPYDVLVLSYVEGVPGSQVWSKLDLPTREHISEQLGRMCGAIHTLHWPIYGVPGVGAASDTQSVRWTDIILRKLVQTYERVQQQALAPQPILDSLVTTLNDGDAVFNSAAPPALTHTDLGLWNVLLRQQGANWRVAAIIDWEWAITADPAWEFANLWSGSDPADSYPLPDHFLHGYKERKSLPPDLRVRQRLYRLLHHFEMLLVCATHFAAEPHWTQSHLHAIEQLLKPR